MVEDNIAVFKDRLELLGGAGSWQQLAAAAGVLLLFVFSSRRRHTI